MSANVTSIAEVRALARRRAERSLANTRVATALMVVVAALLVVGVAAITSASSALAIATHHDRYYFVKRQLLGLGLGTLAMALTSRIPYRFYRRVALLVYAAALVGLVATLVVGQVRYGSRRWIDVGPLTVQPSELAKFAVIVSLAAVMDKKRRLLGDFGHFLAPVAVILGSIGLLVMRQPDLGTTVVIGAAALAVLLVSEAPLRFVIALAGLALLVAVILAVAEPYRFARIKGFLDPWADAGDTGYQLVQSYLALGTGGILGVGLGASRARWFYLPNAHTDFIFSIIGEETGLLGGLVVITLFLLLTAVGWAVAARAPDRFGRMLAAGITTWFAFQALVNIGGVLGVMPITGITLPFVSYGSTALVVSMAALGVLINIARQGRVASRARQ